MKNGPQLDLPDLDGQRVLITGGLGFIGSNLAHKCIELGADVTVFDCLDPASGGNLHNMDGISDDVRIIREDIRDVDAIAGAIRQQDVLFNCAAYTSHPNSMLRPLEDIDVNCRGVVTVLEAATENNRDLKFVHVGATTQIGKLRYSPVDEEHPEFPLDVYSASKTASEKYVLIYGNAYDMFATVVRLGNVFGPRSNIRSKDFGFINYFIGLALQDKQLTVYGDGAQQRNVSYVADAVGALILASQSEASNGEVFFAVADEQYSVAEIARRITESIGTGSVQHVEWPADRRTIEIGDAVISNTKIKRVLGWMPQHNLQSGLAETADYFRSRLDVYL